MHQRILLLGFSLGTAMSLFACGESGDGKGAADGLETACSDGKDNDGDGQTDCEDLDCRVAGTSCALAPPLDRSVASTLSESAKFVYSGPDPLQKSANAKAFDVRRIALLRGRVVGRDGKALPGVRVAISEHAEFGSTLTRSDGLFDLAVNGGARLVVEFTKEGFLPSERVAQPGWQRHAWVAEVGLVERAENSAQIAADADGAQILVGDEGDDSLGVHQPFVVFKPGTTATAELADGTEESLSAFTVHVTEYPSDTAASGDGARGAQFAPGSLPISGGIHYGLDFTVDEAERLHAKHVSFSAPVSIYVENFLKLPVGTPVPLGYYDRSAAQWQPGKGGRVVKVLDVDADKKAVLDLDGDGKAEDDATLKDWRVTPSELAELGKRYTAGTTLWRVTVNHFSPWNMLFPVSASLGSIAPTPGRATARALEVPSRRGAAVVETQALSQSVGISGTPFSLHYQTDRTTAYGPGFQLEIPLTTETVPEGLKRVESVVHIAGHEFRQTFEPEAGQKHLVVWDGTDGFGRLLQGPQTAEVTVSYFFAGSLQVGNGFGTPGSDTVLARDDADFDIPDAGLSTSFEVPIGVWDAKGYDLGGFAIDALHAFDPAHQTVFFGWGDQRLAQNVALVVKQPAKDAKIDLGTPDSVTAAPDGSAIVTDDQQFDASAPGRILRVDPDGSVSVLAGPGAGGDAAVLDLGSPQGIAVKSDGTVIVADYQRNAVRAIHADGSVETLIGENSEDNPVVQASLDDLDGIALGAREELYIANADQVLRFEAGALSVFAGGGEGDDGVPATEAKLVVPSALAVAPDGSVFVSERGEDKKPGGHRVRKIGPDGVIRTVSGTGTPGFSGDGQAAVDATLDGPRGLGLGPDGSLYIADQANNRIRRVTPDGIIQTVVGGGDATLEEGQLATQVKLDAPDGISFGRDGALYIAGGTSLFRVAPGLPELSNTESLIPSSDGRTLYKFDARGKHEETIDAMTGVTELAFSYDDTGRLAALRDKNGLTTKIERAADGKPTAIVAPFGQRTTLSTNAQGAIDSVTDGLGRQVKFDYDRASGLLAHVADPKGGSHDFGYDPIGRLLSVTDPTGYKETLTSSALPDGYSVSVATPQKLVSEYSVRAKLDGSVERGFRLPDQSEVTWNDAITSQASADPDGTTTSTQLAPDMAFGAQSLFPSQITTTTPGGRELTAFPLRAKRLTDLKNALSLEEWDELLEVNGRVYESLYTRKDNAITTTTPMGRTSSTTLDALGRPTTFAAPGLPSVRWDYDSSGRVVRTTRTAGGVKRVEGLAYDAGNGFLASATNANQEALSYERDAIGRLLGVTRPDQEQTSWELDDNDNVLSLTPPGRQPHNFLYQGPSDLLVATIPPEVQGETPAGFAIGETHFEYDGDVALTKIERSDGRDIGFGYDGKTGQLKSVSLSGVILSYGYDSSGALTSVNRSDSVNVALTRDGPLWTGTTWSGAVKGSVSADYDDNLWLKSLTVNNASTVSFSYDDDGLVTQASSSAGALALTRDAATGFVTDTALGAVTTSYGYSGFGELSRLDATVKGTATFSQAIDRDVLGRITHISETVGSATHALDYSYDNLGRLIEADRDGARSTYAYDANGNRTSVTVGNEPPVVATHDAQDRIIQQGDVQYEQSAQGDLVRQSDGANALELSYDELGNLLTATAATGGKSKVIDYVVDGLGRRVARKVGGKFDRAWLYRDALRPIAEIDAAGTFTHFVYASDAPGAPDFLIRSGVPFRVIKDHLGSPRLVVNAQTGVTAQAIDYGAFGEVLANTNPGFQPFGFAGGLYDADTGLVRFGARDYDARSGRWAAKDPSGFAGGDTNVFVYCANDPANFVDLTGREKTSVLRKVWLAAKMTLRFGEKTTIKNVLAHLARGEGVLVATREEAAELARQYSKMKGGTGKIKFDPGHVKDGRQGYEHVHALDADNNRLEGHFFYGRIAGIVSILDLTGDGDLDYRDAFELANPNPFQELFAAPRQCSANDPYCA